MKKLLSLILVLCLLLGLAGCGSTSQGADTTVAPNTGSADTLAAPSSITPLLYQVTDAEGHTIWLFGSIHVGREDFYPLPEYVTSAFDQAEALAVEFDVRLYEQDLAAQVQDLLNYTYIDGTTIQDYIDPELYQEAVALLPSSGMPEDMMKLYKPIFWATLIEAASYETETTSTTLGIDLHMIDAAYARNMPVLSIESPDFQSSTTANFSPELQELCLRQAVDNAPYASQDLLGLLDLWVSGDEEAFSEYLNATQEMPEDIAALMEEYNKAMITDRNLNMTDYAEDLLAEGKPTMICVGAAHIVGEGAMAQLLAERGYTVTRVMPK